MKYGLSAVLRHMLPEVMIPSTELAGLQNWLRADDILNPASIFLGVDSCIGNAVEVFLLAAPYMATLLSVRTQGTIHPMQKPCRTAADP